MISLKTAIVGVAGAAGVYYLYSAYMTPDGVAAPTPRPATGLPISSDAPTTTAERREARQARAQQGVKTVRVNA